MRYTLALIAALLIGFSAQGQASVVGNATVKGTATIQSVASVTGTLTCLQGGPGCTNTTSNLGSCAGVTTCPVTLAVATTSGSPVLLAVTSFNTPSSISTTGCSDTFVKDVSSTASGGSLTTIWRDTTGGGGCTVLTINGPAGSFISAGAIEVHDSAGFASFGLDVSAGPSGTGTSATTGALTPTQANDLFIAVQWNSINAGTLNWTSSNAIFSTGTNQVGASAYLIEVGSAAQTPAWTLGGSGNYSISGAAYHP